MEFLKKHYEKLALAIVSLMMIATALTLVNKLEFAGSEHPTVDRANAKPLGTNDLMQIEKVLKGPLLGTNDMAWIGAMLENPHIDKDLSAKPLDTNELMQVATLLKNPPAWRTNDGPRPFIPEPWNWNGKDLFPAGEKPRETVVITDPAEELDWWVASRTFPMKFMSVASEVGTNKVFAINLPGAGTRFVKIGDPPIRQSIYGTMEEFIVLRYEEKKAEWFDSKVGGKRIADVSELVLQRKSAGVVKEILLVIGRQVLESEPVARYQSTATGETSSDLKKISKFTYKGKAYELLRLDTNPPLLIFKDSQTRKEYRKIPRVVQQF